jgi:hypothetical protein
MSKCVVFVSCDRIALPRQNIKIESKQTARSGVSPTSDKLLAALDLSSQGGFSQVSFRRPSTLIDNYITSRDTSSTMGDNETTEVVNILIFLKRHLSTL